MPDEPAYIHGTCPYDLCTRWVRVIHSPEYPGSGKGSEFLIVEHLIRHPILTGICPATLMHLPLKPEEVEHLRVFAVRDGRKIGDQIQSEADAADRRRTEESKNPASRRVGHFTDYKSHPWFGTGTGVNQEDVEKERERRQKANWKKQSDDILRRDGLIGTGSGMNIGEAIAVARHGIDTADKAKVQLGEITSRVAALYATVEEINQDAMRLNNTETVPVLAPMLAAIEDAKTNVDSMRSSIDLVASSLTVTQEHAQQYINRLSS